jgi:hypothetical protein
MHHMRLWKHWNEILLRFFYSLRGRRQRASAGAAGMGATRAKMAVSDGHRRADLSPALGFKFRFG